MAKNSFLSAFIILAFGLFSCKKEVKPTSTAFKKSILTFKGNNVTFNSLSIDDKYSNSFSEYIFATLSGLKLVFYCKYIDVFGTDLVQVRVHGFVTYNIDEVDYFPVNNYPELRVRGCLNYDCLSHKTAAVYVKIKRNDSENQNFQFENLKFKVGDQEQLLNGTINLVKS